MASIWKVSDFLIIVRGAAPVSREEGSFELDPWNGLLRLGSYYDGLFEEGCEEMDAWTLISVESLKIFIKLSSRYR